MSLEGRALFWELGSGEMLMASGNGEQEDMVEDPTELTIKLKPERLYREKNMRGAAFFLASTRTRIRVCDDTDKRIERKNLGEKFASYTL